MSKYKAYPWSNDSKDEIGCGLIILIIIGVIALLFLGPAITMWLWNWIAVSLFNAPVIGYWTAFGLQWLCHILFGRTVTVRSKS
jgi:membrane-bound metal-dependent hydrolase YbcI (DUF457 family)